jgi:photosystem II stability/assembly factor-like uncharacterized protein
MAGSSLGDHSRADGGKAPDRRRRNSQPLRALGVLACLLVSASAVGKVVAQGPQHYHSLEYRYIGPPGNRIEVVAGVPGDPSVIYAGNPSGGVFKTTDGGLHWHAIFEEIASIGALAVAPSNADIVWIGTGETFIRGNISVGQGIYKSTDAGKTFTRVGLEATGRIARIVVDPSNPEIVHVAALGHSYGPQPERGVFRTRDGGKSWERVLFVDENTGAVDLAIDPSNPRTLFAATWQFAIYPWWAESGGPGSGIHVSRDGGTTWTRVAGRGLPEPPLGRIALAIAPARGNRIYATIETNNQGNLWTSNDGGETWTLTSREPAINRRARYFSRFAVAPDNPDELLFLTQELNRSRDGGKTLEVVPEVSGSIRKTRIASSLRTIDT